MGESLTIEQIRAEAVGAMGADLGELYVEMYAETSMLHLKWGEFLALFATSPERITLLNRAAPSFFRFLKETQLDDFLMHLSRITDPGTSTVKGVKRENMTVCRLVQLVPKRLRPEPKRRLAVLDRRCGFARTRRNRVLAHSDLLTARGLHPEPLPPFDRKAVDDALAALRDVMHWFESHYLRAPVGYEHTIGALGGADALLRFLARRQIGAAE